MHSVALGDRPMLVIGHRGACGYEPENTLRSFQKAIDLGVDMIELDVHCCASGEVVVIHDENVVRTTNGKGLVQHLTFAELQQLDAGKGEKIPTLQNVLDLVNKKVAVNIELKGKNTVEPTVRIIQQYVREHGWQYGQFVVSSFDHCLIKKFVELMPEVFTSCLLEGLPVDYAAFGQRAGAGAVGVARAYVCPALVADARARRLKLFVYTVNDPEEIARVKALGVDGIFSDYPDRLR